MTLIRQAHVAGENRQVSRSKSPSLGLKEKQQFQPRDI